jgi:siroheme decarboxylase
MWFVLAVERPEAIDATVARIEAATGLEVLNLPKLDEYFLELKLSA